jgi:uncharacterized membrane protein
MEIYRLHPIAVHFPVVLLLLATLLLALVMAGRPLERLTQWVLGVGTVSAWAALYTGNLAEDHAEDVWRVPESLLEAHEKGGQITLILFLGSFAAFWLARRFQKKALVAVSLAMALAGSGALVYTGDLGGDIVYKHAIPAGSDAAAAPRGDGHDDHDGD